MATTQTELNSTIQKARIATLRRTISKLGSSVSATDREPLVAELLQLTSMRANTIRNGSTEERKQVLELFSIRAKTGENPETTLVRFLTAMANFMVSYEESGSIDTTTKLQKLTYSPRKTLLKERVDFIQIRQTGQESVEKLVERVRESANNCQFEILSEDLQLAQFMNAVRDDRIRGMLLEEEKERRFPDVVEKARQLTLELTTAFQQTEATRAIGSEARNRSWGQQNGASPKAGNSAPQCPNCGTTTWEGGSRVRRVRRDAIDAGRQVTSRRDVEVP